MVCETWLRVSLLPAVSMTIFLLLYSSTISQLTCSPPRMQTLKLLFFLSLRMFLSVSESEHSPST